MDLFKRLLDKASDGFAEGLGFGLAVLLMGWWFYDDLLALMVAFLQLCSQ